MEAAGLDYFGVDEHSAPVLTLAQRALRAAAPLGLGAVAALVMRRSHPCLRFSASRL